MIVLQGLLFARREWDCHASYTQKLNTAVGLQYLDTRILLAVEANKDVGTEHGSSNPTFTIAPLMYLDG